MRQISPRSLLLVAVLCTSFFTTQAQSAAEPHSWTQYTNARFGYTVCYPGDLLIAQGESDNGDGQKFTAADGAELIVYGTNNAESRAIKDVLADDRKRLTSASGKVTYEVLKPDWFVISGQSGNKVFYEKTIHDRKKDQFVSFELRYDRTDAVVYQAMITRLVKCLAVSN